MGIWLTVTISGVSGGGVRGDPPHPKKNPPPSAKEEASLPFFACQMS